MKMMVALTLLLTIAGYRSNNNNNGCVSAFVPRLATTKPQSSRAIISDNNDRPLQVVDIPNMRMMDNDDDCTSGGEMGRRDAVVRFLATSASIAAAMPANAATIPATEFSEPPTSEASIARYTYDGKDILPLATTATTTPPPATTPVAAANSSATVSAAETTRPKRRADYDGNEAGPVGAADEGTRAPIKGAVMAKERSSPSSLLTSSLEPKVNVPISKEALVGGAVVLFGLMAMANGNEEGGVVEAGGASASGSVPPPMTGGVDANAATPPPPPPVAVAAPKVDSKSSWKFEKPVPYGVQNPAGRNPFLKEVLDYCEGGKVTVDCADSIKGYLDNLADTGAVATTEEVTAIVGYLGSLGGDGAPFSPSTTPEKKRVGAAFASYLDALSAGSAPPPSSAKAVKTYLDTLNGSPDAARSVRVQREAALPPATSKLTSPTDAVAAASGAWDYAAYDNRLTSIEGRVSTLETKVDELPDRVFEKIEAWQTRQEGRLTEEVRKIVNALASSSPSTSSLPPAATEVVHSSPPPPVPEAAVAPPMPVAPVVPYTPLSGAVPERGGLPKAGAPVAGPRKGYRFGGGSSWKSDDSKSPTAQAAPQNMRSSVPKKFAVGGGASWKTGKPKGGGGGYLDNMGP
ncbi:hypothetical protein ACHAXA_003380 [Cyclostephanos tholiformis]|uniref:Diatom pyrenoid component 2 domain-containing protein n=1 Tax=Cyclostephanos tholiformis TaxID=382380 RepID=A0ABD3R7P6_9STRA